MSIHLTNVMKSLITKRRNVLQAGAN